MGTGTGEVAAFRNAGKRYGRVTAVDGLDLVLRPGETVALLGPNGAGKSSSLDLLLGLREPDTGSVELFGGPPGDRGVRVDDRHRVADAGQLARDLEAGAAGPYDQNLHRSCSVGGSPALSSRKRSITCAS